MPASIYKNITPHQLAVAHSRAARNILEFRDTILDQYNLSSPEWFVLGYAATQPSSVGDIANALDVQSTYVTGLLRKLEAKGLIALEEGKQDRRVRLIHTTRKGSATFRTIEKELGKRIDIWLNKLPDTALKNYTVVLDTLAKGFPTII